MSSNIDFVEFVCEQVSSVGIIRNKKMFGEYMVYCNDKPVLLICDDTVFVKILPETISVLGKDTKQGEPYVGAKPHFILDADDKDTAIAVVEALERVIKTPQKKRK